MKYLLFSVILFALFFISSAYRTPTTPDPEEFAAKFIALIKKKDKQAFIDSYSMKGSDMKWLMDQIYNIPYVDSTAKANYASNFSDTSRLQHDNKRVEESYNKIMEWIQNENINVEDLEYVQLDYELRFGPHRAFYALDDSQLYVKHKDKFYCFRLDDSAYINGRWIAGKVKEISPRDQYLNEEYSGNEYAGADSTATVVVMETSPEEKFEPDSTALEPELTKKQQKLERKIQAQQKKLWKLLDEKYK